jgi:hypothetical protein
MLKGVVAVTVAVFVAGGCSTAPAENVALPAETGALPANSRPPVSVAPTTVATASTAPTHKEAKPLSPKQAAIHYLASVKPYNVALERLESAINTGKPVTVLRGSAAKVAAANAAHVRDLGGTRWPVTVRTPVRQLRAESGKAQVYWQRAAQAGSRDKVIEAVLKAAQHDGTEAAGKIRRLLHLEKYDERVYS